MLVLLASSLAVACGDDTTESSGNNDNNTLPDPNNVPVPQGSKLTHVGSCAGQINCAIDVTYSAASRLGVQLLDGDQNPISGARVDYNLQAGELTDTTLDALGSATDAEGMAAVNLRAGDTTGVVEVIVEVPGDNTVEPIKFVAAIGPKDSASYRVNFAHDGPAALRDIDVFLYPSDVSCDDVRQDLAAGRDEDSSTVPMLTAESSARGVVNVDGTLPVVLFPGLENGKSFTVSAQAKSRADANVELAFGCTDMNPEINEGSSVDVTVDLRDYLPRLQGAYEATHTIRINEAVCPESGPGVLPENVCTAIDLIGRLATDPASFLIGQGQGDQGLIGLIVDFLPDDGLLGDLKSAIENFTSNETVSGIARDQLNDFFSDWLNENAPEWVQNSVNITGDIFDTLSELEVVGIIRITEEAVPSLDNGEVVGLLEEVDGVKPGQQVWETIKVNWTGECDPGDSSCREREFSAADLGAGGSVVEGRFTGSVVTVTTEDGDRFALVIDPHSLSLNYGTLALGIIENVVLPSIFDGVTTLEGAIDALLTNVVDGDDGCQGLANFFNEDESSTVNSIAKNLCEQLIQSAGDGVREFLTENLVLEDDESFVMQTAEPCVLSQPDAYPGEWTGMPLPYIQEMGGGSMECSWDISIQAGSSDIDATSPFTATRTTF